MGQLVERAAKALHAQAHSAPPDMNEIWISRSVSLGAGQSQLSDWRREMRRVVRERNSLIHRMLATWNPNSVDSCRDLCEQLDAQRERMSHAHKHLESVVKAIRESHEELARNVDVIVAGILSMRGHGA
jgi:hypothetical protein